MTRITDPQASATSPSPEPHNGKRIVLAEDDPFISRMYLTKLSGAGYEVIVTNNGRDALEQIKELHPDLMMLDINMPELTAFDVVRALQSDGYEFSNSHVVILTNSADPRDRQTASSMGLDYLVKAEMTPRGVLEHISQKLGVKG
jgi:CheY-like chemotaxis protein